MPYTSAQQDEIRAKVQAPADPVSGQNYLMQAMTEPSKRDEVMHVIRHYIASLDFDIDLNQVDAQGRTLFDYAVQYYGEDEDFVLALHESLVARLTPFGIFDGDEEPQALLDKMYNIDALASVDSYYSFLCLSALHQGLDPNIILDSSQTILNHLIRTAPADRVMDYIRLNPAVDINAQGLDGLTPMMTAVILGNTEVSKFLLSFPVSLDPDEDDPQSLCLYYVCDHDYTALDYAITTGKGVLLEQIINAGAIVNEDILYENDAPLTYASKKGYESVVRVLLTCLKPTEVDKAIALSVAGGHSGIEALLQNNPRGPGDAPVAPPGDEKGSKKHHLGKKPQSKQPGYAGKGKGNSKLKSTSSFKSRRPIFSSQREMLLYYFADLMARADRGEAGPALGVRNDEMFYQYDIHGLAADKPTSYDQLKPSEEWQRYLTLIDAAASRVKRNKFKFIR